MHCPSRVGTGPETGGKIFDPYGFSTMGGDKALAFFRHAEIKHGRVAMAGVVGLLVHINHIHFDGYLSPTFGVSFADLSAMGPFDAWNAVPLLGQLQASAAPATADPCCVYLSTRAGGGARWRGIIPPSPSPSPSPSPDHLHDRRPGARLGVLGPGRSLHQGWRAGQPQVPQELCTPASSLPPPCPLPLLGVGEAPRLGVHLI